ncbi:MAG: protoporphyrinogen oxidase [Legionellales bacterium]|nr:protoporphyrinogen oxidase [Legionellales bacterium]
MIRLLLIFLVFLGSVYLGIQLRHDPGYLLIAINHWTIETTLGVAILCLVLLFTLFHGLLLMLRWIIQLPTAWNSWRKKRHLQQATAMTRQGLIEFSEGHWLQAKNHLIKALSNTETPLINYLTAARAAQEMGDNKLRDDYLREAQQSMPDAKIAVELTQAQLQLANHQWEQALATLRHLQDLAPRHPYVLKLLMHLYKELKDWPQLILLLPELKRRHVLAGDAYQRLQQEAYLQAMLDLMKHADTTSLVHWMKALPNTLTHDPEIISKYGYYLIAKNKEAEAEVLLRHSLHKHFDKQLITCYGLISSGEDQLSFAESLLKNTPHSAELFLCLGRLSRARQLWGKAKNYFEQSLTSNPTSIVYLELGQLLEQLKDEKGACDMYKQGLLLLDSGQKDMKRASCLSVQEM